MTGRNPPGQMSTVSFFLPKNVLFMRETGFVQSPASLQLALTPRPLSSETLPCVLHFFSQPQLFSSPFPIVSSFLLYLYWVTFFSWF